MPYTASATPLDELPMIKKLHVHYRISGVYDGVDAVTGDVFFRFSGPIHATPAIDATGTIGTTPGPVIGQITNWRLRFHLAPGANGTTNLDTSVSCDPCELRMNDGAALTAMVDDSGAWLSGINVPMQVRLLPELGGVPTDDTQHACHQLRRPTGGDRAWLFGEH